MTQPFILDIKQTFNRIRSQTFTPSFNYQAKMCARIIIDFWKQAWFVTLNPTTAMQRVKWRDILRLDQAGQQLLFDINNQHEETPIQPNPYPGSTDSLDGSFRPEGLDGVRRGTMSFPAPSPHPPKSDDRDAEISKLPQGNPYNYVLSSSKRQYSPLLPVYYPF